MIFADKLIDLRKKNGWSQEELANKLNVTRQSVSKWESMTSIPDLDKIIKLSQIFGVSTDYLLRDDISDDGQMATSDELITDAHLVSLEEANKYLDQVQFSSKRIALGVVLCIISVVPLILLAGISEYYHSLISENVACGIGVATLLVIIASAVALFICEGMKFDKFEYLDKEALELEYGVASIAERKKEEYEATFRRDIVLGVVLCIVAVVPLMISLIFESTIPFLSVIATCLIFIFVAAGVYLFVLSGMRIDSYKKLLEEGDYTIENKMSRKTNSPLFGLYWIAVTSIYLAWSFITNDWGRTWIIWPVAAVSFVAFVIVVNIIQNMKK